MIHPEEPLVKREPQGVARETGRCRSQLPHAAADVTGEEVVGARPERQEEAVPMEGGGPSLAILVSVFEEPVEEAAEDMLSRAREGRKGERARGERRRTAEEERFSGARAGVDMRGNEAGTVVRK